MNLTDDLPAGSAIGAGPESRARRSGRGIGLGRERPYGSLHAEPVTALRISGKRWQQRTT